MVRAILNGTKRQTRRIVKPQPITNAVVFGSTPYGMPGDRLWVRETWRTDIDYDPFAPTQIDPAASLYYVADGANIVNHSDPSEHQWGKTRVSIHMPRWASRLTLELTRVRIERLHDITEADAWAEGIGREVGRERPLEALFNVCMAFPKLNIGTLAADDPTLFTFGNDRNTPTDYERVIATTGRGVYAALWEGINGPGSWAANPWVWVLDFRRI